MGKYWLHDLPAEIRAAGLDLELYPGWETRSRASGGFDEIWAVFAHHTAGGPNQNTHNAAHHHYVSHQFRPVGNFTLGREGLIILGAAGASNTQGVGGPVATSKGIIPKDKGNSYGIAIEACNRGTGEFWPKVQLDAYVELCAVICKTYGLDPTHDVFAHFEWAPDRKIDPAGGAGQSPYANLGDRYLRWDMDRFRQDIKNVNTGDDDDMANIAIIRPKGYADQFALVPIASAEQARRMGMDGQQPVVVTADRAQLEAQVGYKLTPKADGQ